VTPAQAASGFKRIRMAAWLTACSAGSAHKTTSSGTSKARVLCHSVTNGTTLCLPCVDERYPNHWPDMIPCFLSNNTKRLIRKHNEGTTLVANAVRLHYLHTPYCPKRSVRERLSQPCGFPRQIGKDFKFPTRQQGQNVGPLRLMSASSWPWRWKGRRAD